MRSDQLIHLILNHLIYFFRYFLEPASPLKSIQTSQQLVKSSTTISSNDNIAALKSITLTPPSSLRLFKQNSSHHQQQNQATMQNSQQQNQNTVNAINNFQHQFTPEESHSLFNQTNQQHQTRLNNNQLNGLNRNDLNIVSQQVGSTKASTNLIGNKNNATFISGDSSITNKFTPDSDFIADFGKATIFNATNVNEINKRNDHLINNNNNNKHQNNLNNNNSSIKIQNQAKNGLINGNGENFADFEHNVIYNAAGLSI